MTTNAHFNPSPKQNFPPHDTYRPDLRPYHSTPTYRSIKEPCPNMAEAIRDLTAPITPFAGRIGGNQEFIVNRHDPDNAALIAQIPDAAPLIPLKKIYDLRGFREPQLWKAAIIEGVGTILIVYTSGYIGRGPTAPLPPPSTPAGVFATAAFIGPLIGGITNIFILTILIYTFSSVSGAHFNPLITIGTFCVRLTTLPRMVLYIAFQLIGASLAGLMLRASFDTRDFTAGGCFLFESESSVSSAFAVEFMGCITILFFAFGLGLDPRQSAIFGPALAPALVGIALGVLAFGLAFNKPGYGGPSMNPARCFGVYVGSRFPRWHWHHWVAALAADILHGLFYCLVPPWTSGMNAEKAHEKLEALRARGEKESEREGGNGNGIGLVVNTGVERGDEIGRQGLGRRSGGA